MDAYKAVEDGYHALLLVHSEKRKIIQGLLEDIQTLQAEAIQIPQCLDNSFGKTKLWDQKNGTPSNLTFLTTLF